MSLERFQAQFHKSDLIHLNNAGLQPITRVACEKVNYWSRRFWEEGFNTDADYMADVKSSRGHLAKLIGCQWDEIAFFQAASGGINQFAFGVGLKKDDEVLMWDQEYSSHLYPWKEACDKAGASLKILKSEENLSTPTDKYISAITDKTKVVAFSWVQFQSGARMDVEALIRHCKAKNIFVFVDVAQGLGIRECQLWSWGADAVAGGSHKWLCSPVGVGYLAIRKNLVGSVKPHSFGAYTYGTCDDPSDFACEPKRDATKYEPGSKQVLEITALGASCQLISEIGVKTIEAESLRLAKTLRLGLMDKGYEVISPFRGEEIHSTPFINFKPKPNQKISEATESLSKRKISYALRGPGIRLTPQAFNTDAEIAIVLSTL